MSQREYSTNPNTIRARERKARMNAWEKAEYNAKTADNKAILRQFEIARDTESFQMMSAEEREELVKGIAERTMEKRRQRGIDYDSKMRRFEGDQQAQQAQQAASAAAADGDFGGNVGGGADGSTINTVHAAYNAATHDTSTFPDTPAVLAPGYPAAIAFPGHQQLAHLLNEASETPDASTPRSSHPDGDEYVSSTLPYGEGGAPARPPPQIQGFLQDPQTVCPAINPADHQERPFGGSMPASAYQPPEAVNRLYVSITDFNEMKNTLFQMNDTIVALNNRIEQLEAPYHSSGLPTTDTAGTASQGPYSAIGSSIPPGAPDSIYPPLN